jgi:hypothetical protein
MHTVSAGSLRCIERFISGAEQRLTEFVARHVDQPIVELTNDETDAD